MLCPVLGFAIMLKIFDSYADFLRFFFFYIFHAEEEIIITSRTGSFTKGMVNGANTVKRSMPKN